MTDTANFPKLGLRPPVNKPALALDDFFTGVLPATPPVDYLAYRSSWPWWLNNQYGTCVAATKQGLKALVSAKLTGQEVVGTDADVIADYKTQNPNFPTQDGGMDIQTFLEYLQQKGEIVAFGTVSLANHNQGISILGALWTAITVRYANVDDYNAGRDWDYHPLSKIYGFHSVLSAGHRDVASDDVRFTTWTKETGFTDAFWGHDVGQTWGVILPEHLGSKEFMDGMDLAALADAFLALTGRVLPIPAPVNPPGAVMATATKRTAIEPLRVLDTRHSLGHAGALLPGVPVRIQITGGPIPATAVEIDANLTVTEQTGQGYLYIGPTAKPAPTSSNLNFSAADPANPGATNRANAVPGLALDATGGAWITYVGPAGTSVAAILDILAFGEV